MFDSLIYGPAVAKILGDGQRLMPLGPGKPEDSKRSLLNSFEPTRDLPNVKNQNAAKACHAGLWLYWDFLDDSHSISQELHTAEGSAWHAIMHRREPDAWNSNYWWNRVGYHDIFGSLKLKTANWKFQFTTPQKFVELCESARGKSNADEVLAKQVQLLEWQMLFDHCFQMI